ncbi:MAG: acyl-CoA dehydrogenase family protein [Acidimicrobiales bacterium]
MSTPEQVRAEVEAWLDAAWDPGLTVREWWRRLAEARYGASGLDEPWGRGYDREQVRAVQAALRERKVLGPPGGIGVTLALPTILAHGTDAQKQRYVPGILDGADGWCQLFSEPGAGSDLAGLQTRAVRDGDEWVVNGQKVWTSTGQHADYGILIARTDPELPKHQGITYFLLPMRQPGVEVRPLREMTGQAVFNEVFFTDARVLDADRLGGLNQGWMVANTTLTHERAGIGANEGLGTRAAPGSIAGYLDREVGELLARPRRASRGAAGGVGPGTVAQLKTLARQHGRSEDPTVRQQLARLHSEFEIMRMAGWYAKAGGARTGAEGNLAKLRMTALVRTVRDAAGLIAGPYAQLSEEPLSTGFLSSFIVGSPAPSIYGGTDEVQRNIIGERALGLPKEPGPHKDTPFKELPANATR